MVSSSKSPSRRQQIKAKRPYSDYNVFYRLERMRILQSSGTKIDDATAATLTPADHCDPFEHPRPQKYVDIRLPPYWYSSYINGKAENVGGGPKRKHRKCPGRLSMATLCKLCRVPHCKSSESHSLLPFTLDLNAYLTSFYAMCFHHFRVIADHSKNDIRELAQCRS